MGSIDFTAVILILIGVLLGTLIWLWFGPSAKPPVGETYLKDYEIGSTSILSMDMNGTIKLSGNPDAKTLLAADLVSQYVAAEMQRIRLEVRTKQ